MSRHRLLPEMEPIRLPQPPAPAIASDAFVMFPLGCPPATNPVQWLCQQALYRWAFEEAQAVARPSILQRDLLGVWN
jgi:hypothetical protein